MTPTQAVEQTVERVREVIRLKHYALSTEDTYCGWVARYVRYIYRLPEDMPSEKKFGAFLTMLAKEGLSAKTCDQAFHALLFLYEQVREQKLGKIESLRPKVPTRVRRAPSVADTKRVLEAVEDIHGYPTRLIAWLLYGSGLRVSEPLNLRVKDLDFAASRLYIHDAKGGKDRVVRLPCRLMTDLKDQLRRARLIHEIDVAAGVPVPLPDRLGTKYPQNRFAWQWAWVFPSKTTCHHPRTKEIVRWRCHESNVQRAVKAAARQFGLESVITPHIFRHAYATHTLERGANVRDVQQALGHKYLDTTMTYVRPEAERVVSPLD